jgi:hypothetical protein
MTECERRGWHSWRPTATDEWQCQACDLFADRDPSEPCTSAPLLGSEHRWFGHDARGLLCQAESAWNTAKRVHCTCGATKSMGTILSREPDGFGYYYGFAPGDHRQINVRRGPVDLLWRAFVGGVRVGDGETGVWNTKEEAEAAALAWAEQTRESSAT